jgi:hypothetical protein
MICSTLCDKHLSLTTGVLPAMILAASLMVSLAPITAFAEKDASGNKQVDVDSNSQRDINQMQTGDRSLTIDPTAQDSVQTGINVAVNPRVITDKESCKEANDHVTQENVQSSDQNARRDVKSGEGSITDGSTYQKSTQFERNIAVDEEVVMPLPLPK